jgi:hypothetical protein
MRRRLYFTLPDVDCCKQVVTELQAEQISSQHIHVIANENISLDGLPEANELQKTELVHGAEVGATVGGAAGMLGGLLAVTFPPAGIVLGGGAMMILATTLAAASFGGIVSALVARDIPNHELDEFQTALAQGHILLILDIPTKKVAEICHVVKQNHPEVNIGIVDPQNRKLVK